MANPEKGRRPLTYDDRLAIETVREGLELGQSPAHVCSTDERVGFSK